MTQLVEERFTVLVLHPKFGSLNFYQLTKFKSKYIAFSGCKSLSVHNQKWVFSGRVGKQILSLRTWEHFLRRLGKSCVPSNTAVQTEVQLKT